MTARTEQGVVEAPAIPTLCHWTQACEERAVVWVERRGPQGPLGDRRTLRRWGVCSSHLQDVDKQEYRIFDVNEDDLTAWRRKHIG